MPRYFVLDLEAPLHPAEILEAVGDRRKGEIEFHRRRRRGQGIEDIVPARHLEGDPAQVAVRDSATVKLVRRP